MIERSYDKTLALTQIVCKNISAPVQTMLCIILLLLVGCTSIPIDQVELMPAPDVYGDGLLNPLPEYNPLDKIPYNGVV